MGTLSIWHWLVVGLVFGPAPLAAPPMILNPPVLAPAMIITLQATS